MLGLPAIIDHLDHLPKYARVVEGVFKSHSEAETFLLRLQAVEELLVNKDTHQPGYADLAAAACPGLWGDSLRVSFARFQRQLEQVATKSGHEFNLIKPAGRGKTPEQIICHFAGKPLPRALDEPTRRSIDIIENGPELAQPRFIPEVIRIFVSFATRDQASVKELVRLLRTTWGQQRTHKIEFWQFDDTANGGIVSGEPNEERIRQEMANCPLGLILLSPDYMASDFIKRVELPTYFPRQRSKHPVLVNLRNSGPSARHLAPGMDKDYIFPPGGGSFDDCKEDAGCRERFAMALNEHIEVLCRRLYPKGQAPAVAPQEPVGSKLLARRELQHLLPDPEKDEVKLAPARHANEAKPDGVNALDDLIAWAQAADRSRYFALLGEVGAGKTTTCLMFARTLNAQLGKVKAYYFDMRYVNYDGLLQRTNKRPLLRDILASILTRKSVPSERCSPEDYLAAVRNEQAVIIFDGLDEVLVSLDDGERTAFMHQLMSALPLEAARKPSAGKLLLACRTHFFRSTVDERGAFCVQGREGLGSDMKPDDLDRRASFEEARMLPFTEEQIRIYFDKNIPGMPFEKIWGLLEQIHNLQELATRPYLLNLIRRQLPRLQQSMDQGKSVVAVDLYAGFLEDWSTVRNRDHAVVMQPSDKLRLMSLLAAHLWREETKAIAAPELESWMIRTIVADPVWRFQYGDWVKGKQAAELLSELRTTTFVARWDGDAFRFAHTSIQEYFVGQYLFGALLESRDGDWDFPMVSMETLDFLGELLQKAKPAVLLPLERMMGSRCLRAACLAFAYWMRAIQKGYPEPKPEHVNLAGVEPDNWEALGQDLVVSGHGPHELLPLRGANMEGANLQHGSVRWVDLTDANLRRLNARQTTLEHVVAYGAQMVGADFSGSNGRKMFVTEEDLQGAILNCCWSMADVAPIERPKALAAQWQWGHGLAVRGVVPSPDGLLVLSGSYDTTLKLWDVRSGQCTRTFSGHNHAVSSCAFSSDGHFVLSGSYDQTLKLWDSNSGQCLKTLLGHTDLVSSCAFSVDGRLALSGSRDNSLKVWEVGSGECLHTLLGHGNSVLSCAFSPDGKLMASSSADETIKLWQTLSGECLTTFSGHSDLIWSCAFSPDGKHLLSASHDRTLKLWDIQTGHCVTTFSGHGDVVWSCAFSPDGKRILSSSYDKTLKLWDVFSGKCLSTISGHNNGVWCCAFSFDGELLLSGSADNTLKFWDALSGECLSTFPGNDNAVCSCAFSPDGMLILSGSGADALRLWDARTGECLETRPTDDEDFKQRLADWTQSSQGLITAKEGGIHVLDRQTGESIWSQYQLPDGQVGRWDERLQRPIRGFIPDSAWRYLRWRTEDGKLHHAEVFGPLESVAVPMPEMP